MAAARLIIASSEQCADLYWATRFYVPDPITFIEHKGRKILIASDLEVSRAKKEADVDLVLSQSGIEKKLRRAGHKIRPGIVLDAVLRERRIKRLQVPSYFPLQQAENLRKRGYKVEVVPDPFYPDREIKSVAEKHHITAALRATEAGIQAAIDVLKKAKVKGGKIYRNGAVLTSEALRRVIELKMMDCGALGQHTIVACGKQAADPHCRGTGPLYANQTIVLDVFPKSMATGYHGDITRTVVKGRASEALKKMYAAVKKSQETGIRSIRHGVDAAHVHGEVSRVLEAAGFKTGILNGKPQGFIHSTGHGLGLDIHESPRVSRLSNRLRSGHVVTVEPGLYYEKLGGIRIEDVVYITKKGCEVLTRIPKVFEIP
ncbi:MAG TPA: Xaa-Pro peptidase family protein [bacterium]|nr:Xaa-Pro peptidase family protein [bacterium]